MWHQTLKQKTCKKRLYKYMTIRMKANTNILCCFLAAMSLTSCPVFVMHATAQIKPGPNTVSLASAGVRCAWTKTPRGWQLQQLTVKKGNSWVPVPNTSGEYTLLYAAAKPDSLPVTIYNQKGEPVIFPEPQYRYLIPVWREVTRPVSMNQAGKAIHFYPAAVKQDGKNGNNVLYFTQESDEARIKAMWQMDRLFANDIHVTLVITAKQDGYFSMATPTLATIKNSDLSWAAIPGYFQSNVIEKDFIKAYAYGQGIPDRPVVVRERTASTLSPLVSNNKGITLAVIPQPGTGRDPWSKNKSHSDWQLGLSVMNRKAALTPTVYHPVLGEKGSYLKKGDSVRFAFRYTLQPANWYTVYKHAVNDIYRLKDFLALKQTKQSLTDRILSMYHYVIDDSTSKWRTDKVNGLTIGAQDYLGGVYGADKDAMKNSDYGAMWMLATIMQDSVLQQTRLPYARNFKLAQQNTQEPFFNGAAAGQYYLHKSKTFTEEWGPYVEPIGTTYYMLMDIGNVLLFKPQDTALQRTLRAAADKLLNWMSPEGEWAVAYDHATQKELFTDVQDLRPTFYGLFIAYKLLGDQKYFDAARKGADWYITHAVDKGRFLGVCGDARFVADFATGQSVQALLDLYDVTRDERYRKAAIATAKIYTTSVYTHPIATTEQKMVNGVARQDWEISQVGLSFEHGGSIGSANNSGPILLASHAGMFVRMYDMTKDSLFLVMARAAALGRDAFVDPATSVASYYWSAMNRGAGPYPHHAWWQIGWITDYLLAEAGMRSSGRIQFPRGFITPKVGPHQTVGFADGRVYGHPATLLLKEGLVKTASPYLDYYCAINRKEKKLYLLLLNDDDEVLNTQVNLDYARVEDAVRLQPVTVQSIGANGETKGLTSLNDWSVTIPAYGLQVIEVSYK
jgi:hypothetical protein